MQSNAVMSLNWRAAVGVVVVALTENPRELPERLRSAFAGTIHMAVPSRSQRSLLFSTFAASMPVAADVNFDELAALTNGCVAADIHAICAHAHTLALVMRTYRFVSAVSWLMLDDCLA